MGQTRYVLVIGVCPQHSNTTYVRHALIIFFLLPGKSHVIRAFQYEAKRLLAGLTETPDDVTVLLLAYTGTAAFNIGGRTIHSAFNIGVNTSRARATSKYQPLGEDLLTSLRLKYKYLQVIIIDEVSMVGKKMTHTINERLKQIKRNDSPFGKVSILAVGDFYQIAPVGDTMLCKDDKGDLCQSPWALFKLWNLSQIMRQRDDLEFAKVLNTMRTRLKSEIIQDNDIQLLTSRCVTDGNAPNDVLHIYALNKDVKKYNDKMLHMTCENIITIQALDVPLTGNQKGAPRTTPVRDAKTMLADSVKLAANARVMLTTNLDVSDGLSNGVLGTVADIVKGQMSHHQPEYICVRFDNSSVGTNVRPQNPLRIGSDVVMIKPYTEQFRHEGVNHTRLQYPLKLSWACSIHKTQGMTLKSAAVSLKNIFQPGMAYVALSRVTSLAGLHLLGLR